MTQREKLGVIILDAASTVVLFPIYAFVRWVVVFDANVPRETVIANFTAGFPTFMRDPHAITLWSVYACAVAFALALISRRFAGTVPRLIAAAVAGVAGILGAWNLFTMM